MGEVVSEPVEIRGEVVVPQSLRSGGGWGGEGVVLRQS